MSSRFSLPTPSCADNGTWSFSIEDREDRASIVWMQTYHEHLMIMCRLLRTCQARLPLLLLDMEYCKTRGKAKLAAKAGGQVLLPSFSLHSIIRPVITTCLSKDQVNYRNSSPPWSSSTYFTSVLPAQSAAAPSPRACRPRPRTSASALRIRFHHQHNTPPLPSPNTIRHVIAIRPLVNHGRTN